MKEFKDYFSKSEIVLWSSSVMVIIISFCVFDRINYMTLCASLIGVTSLIFNAKGNPFGQLLMVVFSLLYGIISYTFSYYGEMITYLGMTMPMAIFALISWLKNPYNGNKAEVKVNSIGKRENVCMWIVTFVVTFLFYLILKCFNTANIIPSTISVTTSFLAVYLTFRRSPYFACKTVKTTNWDSKEFLQRSRESWAEKVNQELEKKSLPQRVDHRSFKEQGIEKIPTQHIGVSANAMEKRGIESQRGNENREIKKANGQIQTIEILEKQTQKEIAFIREDISWNRHHEEIAKIEEQIPKAAGNEKVLLSVQAGLLKLYDKAKLIEPTKTSEGRTIEIDGRKVPYFEYHKNKLVGDISFAQDKVKGYLDMLAQQRQEAPQEQGGFAARREVFKQQEAPQEKPKIDTAYVERMAQQLATVRNEFVRETVNSHERTRYQPNPIYARQANEIESVAKTVAEQSRTIEAFKAERDKLGMFKGKEKKEIQGKIDNFERLRRSNLDKLKALGVSNLSKADEAAEEKRTLAAQEQEKAQAARRNEGAGSRAEEAKQVFLEAAKRIPADQRQAVLERMEQYNSHEAGGMEVFKAEIEARRVLDSALKEQTQDREHEKTKVKGRGRTD